MNFKVGDRVRKVAEPRRQQCSSVPLGAEGVIESDCYRNGVDPEHRFSVRFDYRSDRCFYMAAHQLAPLAPPAADTWAAEKVKQVTRPIHEPIRGKERA